MLNKKAIDSVHAGSRAIRESTLNGVIDGVNKMNASGIDWDTIEHYYDDGKTTHVTNIPPKSETSSEADYEFKTIKESVNSVSVTRGDWVRCGVRSNSATDAILVVVPDGTDQYVTATLASDGTHDPALIPDEYITLAIEATEPADDEYNIKRAIARINTYGSQIGDIFQIRTGGRIDDTVVRCDTDSFSAAAPVRATIEKNKTTSEHQDELQLYNVDECVANSLSFPYFDSDADAGGDKGVAGTLKWACPDAELTGNVEESIEISTNAGGTTIMQIFEFRTAASIGNSPADADLLMFKNISDSDVDYISFADLQTYIETNFNFATANVCTYIEANCSLGGNHYDLADIVAVYHKHDHGNYWQNPTSVAGRHGAASWDYQVNLGSSIGNAAGQKVIDQDNETLEIGNATPGTYITVDWGNRYLYDYNPSTGQKVVVDWGAQVLKTDNARISLDWHNMALEENGVECLTWYSDYITVKTPVEFVVETTTNASDGAGAIVNSGGYYGAQGIYVDNGDAGYAVNALSGAINVVNNVYSVAGTQVVTSQQAHIADVAVAGTDQDGTCRAKVNAILSMLEAHGLVASS